MTATADVLNAAALLAALWTSIALIRLPRSATDTTALPFFGLGHPALLLLDSGNIDFTADLMGFQEIQQLLFGEHEIGCGAAPALLVAGINIPLQTFKLVIRCGNKFLETAGTSRLGRHCCVSIDA